MTNDEELRLLKSRIEELIKNINSSSARFATEIDSVDSRYQESSKNLAHYLALRSNDQRQLQFDLIKKGLSSLGRSEGHVLRTLKEIARRLGDTPESPESISNCNDLSWDEAEILLHKNTRALFGSRPPTRHEYVMVTAPDATEATEEWIRKLLASGMNCLRINSAHESASEWRVVAERARKVAKQEEKNLRIFVDLPGPKLRTTNLPAGPAVKKVRPERDAWGVTTRPSSMKLGTVQAEDTIGISKLAADRIHDGDQLLFTDTRNRHRILDIRKSSDGVLTAACERTYYYGGETVFSLVSDGEVVLEDRFIAPPPQPAFLLLTGGDQFLLTDPERTITADQDSSDLPAIGCSIPGILKKVEVGNRILFDDGRLPTIAREVFSGGVRLEVMSASGSKFKLKSEKGINFPDTELGLSAMTDEDVQILKAVAPLIDATCLSFVHTKKDVEKLQSELEKLNARHLGIVLKIETRAAVSNLPSLLMQAMRSYPVGVMIARGDLAVECGFERLAELQEEILWFCEASHLPVIWATQVLENLAKTGIPSRAEITDAAMGVRAECVMLNKGPFIAEAVQTLVGILTKMESHQYKKKSMMRALKIVSPNSKLV